MATTLPTVWIPQSYVESGEPFMACLPLVVGDGSGGEVRLDGREHGANLWIPIYPQLIEAIDNNYVPVSALSSALAISS